MTLTFDSLTGYKAIIHFIKSSNKIKQTIL